MGSSLDDSWLNLSRIVYRLVFVPSAPEGTGLAPIFARRKSTLTLVSIRVEGFHQAVCSSGDSASKLREAANRLEAHLGMRLRHRIC